MAFRERKGFVGSAWNTVDMTSPGNDMEEHFKPPSCCNSVIDFQCVGNLKLWCPRLHTISSNDHNGKNTPSSDVGRSAAQISTLFIRSDEAPLTTNDDIDFPPDTDQVSTCRGRAVVYRDGSYIAIVLFSDWEDENDFPAEDSELVEHNLSSPTPSGFSVMCMRLQVNIAAAIAAHTPAKVAVRKDALPLRSRADSSGIGLLKKQPRDTTPAADIPDGVGFIYANDCNVACKAAYIYRSHVFPMLGWPTPLPFGCQSILPLLFSGRARFPLSCGQVAGSLSPKTVAAINDLASSLSGEAAQHGTIREGCIRVSSVHNGGVWVLGRRFGERTVIFIVESCSTLNEMHDVVNRTMETVLGSIMI
ncbi:unnamed protein product [Symbiodinium microadriaticum]|nr:unnamed protein product [Symbiodinium microadriaticum]